MAESTKLDIETIRRKFACTDRDLSSYILDGAVLGTAGMNAMRHYLTNLEREAPVNFRNSMWVDLDIYNMPFRGADFSGAILKRIRFLKCCLDHTRFDGVLYDSVRFEYCSAIGMILKNNIDITGAGDPFEIRHTELATIRWGDGIKVKTFQDLDLKRCESASDSRKIMSELKNGNLPNVELLDGVPDKFSSSELFRDMRELDESDAYEYMKQRIARIDDKIENDEKQGVLWDRDPCGKYDGRVNMNNRNFWVFRQDWRKGAMDGTRLRPGTVQVLD